MDILDEELYKEKINKHYSFQTIDQKSQIFLDKKKSDLVSVVKGNIKCSSFMPYSKKQIQDQSLLEKINRQIPIREEYNFSKNDVYFNSNYTPSSKIAAKSQVQNFPSSGIVKIQSKPVNKSQKNVSLINKGRLASLGDYKFNYSENQIVNHFTDRYKPNTDLQKLKVEGNEEQMWVRQSTIGGNHFRSLQFNTNHNNQNDISAINKNSVLQSFSNHISFLNPNKESSYFKKPSVHKVLSVANDDISMISQIKQNASFFDNSQQHSVIQATNRTKNNRCNSYSQVLDQLDDDQQLLQLIKQMEDKNKQEIKNVDTINMTRCIIKLQNDSLLQAKLKNKVILGKDFGQFLKWSKVNDEKFYLNTISNDKVAKLDDESRSILQSGKFSMNHNLKSYKQLKEEQIKSNRKNRQFNSCIIRPLLGSRNSLDYSYNQNDKKFFHLSNKNSQQLKDQQNVESPKSYKNNDNMEQEEITEKEEHKDQQQNNNNSKIKESGNIILNVKKQNLYRNLSSHNALSKSLIKNKQMLFDRDEEISQQKIKKKQIISKQHIDNAKEGKPFVKYQQQYITKTETK